MSVAEALLRRRSHREFRAEPLTAAAISQLCWAAQGISDAAGGLRTAPSAGALYPMKVIAVDASGAWEYLPARHALRRLLGGDLRARLKAAALDQPCVGGAALCLVIAMNAKRTAEKYGRRAQAYCLMEAGHVAQNVLLQATALGLGAAPVGAFEEDKVAAILKLRNGLRPVYLVALGVP